MYPEPHARPIHPQRRGMAKAIPYTAKITFVYRVEPAVELPVSAGAAAGATAPSAAGTLRFPV